MKTISAKLLLVISLILTAFSAVAEYQFDDINIDEVQIQKVVASQVGSDQTCLDEYLVRQNELKKFLIWAPPMALVAVPAATLVGGYTSLFIASAFTSGWDQLGYMILGGMASGAGVLGTFIFKEVSKGVEFANSKRMVKIITAAHNQDFENKTFVRFFERYNEKYSANPKTKEELADAVIELDESGKLCDGEVRGYLNPKNAKYALAKRRHLMKYLFYHF